MESSLNGLLLACIGALGVLVEYIRRRLEINTQITKEARAAANGHLVELMDELAAERNRTLGLRAIVRERDDRLQFVLSRHPETEATLASYKRRRSYVYSVGEEEQAISDLLKQPPPSPQTST